MNSNLPTAAQGAWSAYSEMKLTKQAHFDYLQALAEKYQKYGQPNAGEAAKLKDLLAAHDTQVQHFRTELQRLRDSDSQAHAAFIAHIASEATTAGKQTND